MKTECVSPAVVVLALLGCGDSSGEGASGTGGAPSTGSSSVASTASAGSPSTSASTSAGEGGSAITPDECNALTYDACQDFLPIGGGGCVPATGYRFPDVVQACQVPMLACREGEPIGVCIYIEPGVIHQQTHGLYRRDTSAGLEVFEWLTRPVTGISGWTLGCDEPPLCDDWDQQF